MEEAAIRNREGIELEDERVRSGDELAPTPARREETPKNKAAEDIENEAARLRGNYVDQKAAMGIIRLSKKIVKEARRAAARNDQDSLLGLYSAMRDLSYARNREYDQIGDWAASEIQAVEILIVL